MPRSRTGRYGGYGDVGNDNDHGFLYAGQRLVQGQQPLKIMNLFKYFASITLLLFSLPLSAQTISLRCVGQAVASGVEMPRNTYMVERFYELSPNLIVWHDGTETTTIKRDELPKHSTQNQDLWGSYSFTVDHFSFRRYFDWYLWAVESYETFDINRKTGVWKAFQSFNNKYPQRKPHSYEINGECEPWSGKRKF